MSAGEVQNTVVGFAFISLGLAWLIVPAERLPMWLRLDRFARSRVMFALLTIALGAFVAGTSLLLGRSS